jgi:hypothetical protein
MGMVTSVLILPITTVNDMADMFANMASLLQNGFQIAIQDCFSVQRVSPGFSHAVTSCIPGELTFSAGLDSS